MVQALSPPQGHQQQQQRDWLREDRHSQDGSGMPGGSAGDIRVQAGAAGHVAGATVGGASSSGAALSASLPIHAAVISQGCLTGSKSGDVLLQLLLERLQRPAHAACLPSRPRPLPLRGRGEVLKANGGRARAPGQPEPQEQT